MEKFRKYLLKVSSYLDFLLLVFSLQVGLSYGECILIRKGGVRL